jgi:hypothetical protein
MQIWLNGATSQEDLIDLPIQPGVDAAYEFPMHKTLLTRVRLKLGDAPGSWVVLHRIYVRQGSKVISELPPEALTTFTGYSAVKDPDHGPAAYVLQERQAMLDESNIDLKTGAGPIKLAIAKIVGAPGDFFAGFVVFGALVVALIGITRRRLLLIPAVVLALVAVYFLPSLAKHLPLANDVSKAVSFCAFIGVNKPRERYMILIAGVLAVAIPALIGWSNRWRSGGGDTVDATETASTQGSPGWSSRWVAVAVNAVPLALIALLYAPDLKGQLAAAQAQTWTDNWDGNNFLSWDYLADRGLVPMKDFFYPYGLQYLFDSGLPWGSVLRFMTMMLFWGYTVIGTWALLSRFFSGRGLVLRHLTLMVFLGVFALSGFDLGTRYAAPLGIVLLFASLRPSDGLLDWKRIVFCVALLQLTLFEVAQAVYAFGPILFLSAVELVLSLRRQSLVGTLRWLGTTGLTVALPVVGAAIVMQSTGQLSGLAFFYGQVSALTSTYAFPAPVYQWVTNPYNISSFDFWAFPVTLALGTYGLIAYRGERQAGSARVAAVGLIGFMIMQRQVVRDGTQELMWFSAVYGILLWAVLEWSRSRVRHWGAVAALLGTVVALSVASGAFATGWKSLSAGPARASGSVGALIHDRSTFSAVDKTRWAPSRFASYSQWNIVKALEREPVMRRGGRFWVLGDAGAAILLSHDRWPYYFTEFYDGTPIAYQKKVLRQLRTMPPARVLFDFAPWQSSFDDVPNIVRVPLLFDWAVRSLVPSRTVGDWAILRPRTAHEAIDLAWWRRRIGTTIDLGQIPTDVRLGSERDLCLAGPRCRSYLVITPTPGTPQPPDIVVPVKVNGLQFFIRVETAPGAYRYVVDLNRVWFWSAAPPSASRSIGSPDAPNVSVILTKRLRDPGALY